MQLQDYALGQMEYKTNLGYVRQGCGTSNLDTTFSGISRTRGLSTIFGVIVPTGVFCQFVFVWIVSAVILKMKFKMYSQQTFTYSHDVYGTFWGISTAAVGLLGTLYCIYLKSSASYIVNKRTATTEYGAYVYCLLSALLFVVVMELPVAIYTARKATVAVPGIFKHPATLLCCGRKRRAECFVTTLALWVDLVALQLALLHVAAIAFVVSVAPFAIVTNVMLVVLALTCLVNFLSLLFTIFAHICTPADQRVHSSSMVLRAVVVLPLLFMILCYGIIAATLGSVTNTDAKKDNIPSFANSIVTPILLGLVIIFLKRFISLWLKWSPQENENSDTQETDEELLHP